MSVYYTCLRQCFLTFKWLYNIIYSIKQNTSKTKCRSVAVRINFIKTFILTLELRFCTALQSILKLWHDSVLTF